MYALSQTAMLGCCQLLTPCKIGRNPLTSVRRENPVVHEASCIELLHAVPWSGTYEDLQGVVPTEPEAEV